MMSQRDELHFDQAGSLEKWTASIDNRTTRFTADVLKNGKITGSELDNSSYIIVDHKNNWETRYLPEGESKDIITSYVIGVIFKQDASEVALFFEFPRSVNSVRSTLIIDKLLGGHLNDY